MFRVMRPVIFGFLPILAMIVWAESFAEFVSICIVSSPYWLAWWLSDGFASVHFGSTPPRNINFMTDSSDPSLFILGPLHEHRRDRHR